MADWDKLTGLGNVEDRRGMGTAVLGGGGLIGVAVVVVMSLLSGNSGSETLTQVLNQLQNTQAQQQTVNPEEFSGVDSYEKFASTVLGSNNTLWAKVFEQSGQSYQEPRLVLFRGATQSACGGASSSTGPHYCPADETIYLDETFFDELKKLGSDGGDVAEAYVIAHEVGHHVQTKLGITDTASSGGLTNADSVKLELQADCFAGVWANSIANAGVFEPGEITEALGAAAAVGDDRIQTTTQGRVNPESWTHGSSEQRVSWFNRGYNTGSPDECDTFR